MRFICISYMRNISGRRHGELRDVLTREFLYQEHYVKKKPMYQIAKDVGCTHKSVTYYLNKYKMPIQIYDIFHPSLKAHPYWKGHGDISMSYWGNVRQGAKHRNIGFNITIEEAWDLYLKQNRKCALSGRPIGFEQPKSNTASLDRIDSSKPYELKNVHWVHRDLNYAKQSMTVNDFIQMCIEVTSYAKLQNTYS